MKTKFLKTISLIPFLFIFMLVIVIWHTIGFFVGLFTGKNPFKYASEWADKHAPFNVQ